MTNGIDAHGLLVAVRAQPRSRRPGIVGTVIDTSGRERLRIAISEPPEDGRASRAVCAVLARALQVPPSRVTVRSGAGAREKLLHVEGDPDLLSGRLARLLAEAGG